jgi:putative PIN family toxin of toxin-antitoxin system
MKVVLDTNILISALFWRGPPYEVLRAAIDGRFTLCLSDAIEKELEGKLLNKFRFPASETSLFLHLLKSKAAIADSPVRVRLLTSDPSDNRILECARSCHADYLVSGDSTLLALGSYRRTRILTAREFVGLLHSQSR